MIFILLLLVNCAYSKSSDIRLPRHVIPQNYDLKILPNFTGDPFTFEGQVEINILCVEEKNSITLHSGDLNINKISLINFVTGDVINVTIQSYDHTTNHLTLSLSKDLTLDEKYTLSFSYNQTKTNDKNGFVKEIYIDEKTGMNESIYWTQLQPIYARYVFPCFDEPDFKATFQLTIRRPNNFSTLSNMPLKDSSNSTNGTLVYDQFQKTPKMSTYLLAFVISKFSHLQVQEKFSQNFKIWGPNLTEYTLIANKIGSIYNWHETYLKVSQPIKKTDLVAINGLTLDGAENWGLFTMKSSKMHNYFGDSLYMKARSSELLRLISTLLGHNWFGNLVTHKWWSDIWLTKGIPYFMAVLSLEKEIPEIMNIYIVYGYQWMLHADSLGYLPALKHEINSNQETLKIFNSITDLKGSILTKMMKELIGDVKFRDTMNHYLNQYSLGNVEENDLFDTFKGMINGTTTTLKEVMNTWTLQAGYPLVTVKVNVLEQTVELSQKRFLKTEVINEEEWKIPFKYQILNFGKSSIGFKLMTKKTLKFSESKIDSSTVFIANFGVLGYFRVNYGPEMWQKIIKVLLEKHELVHLQNRAQLIDDSFSLADFKIEDKSLPLNLSLYLVKEDEPLPWLTFFQHMNKVVDSLYECEDIMNIKDYIKKLTQKSFEKFKSYLTKEMTILNGDWKRETWKFACFSGNNDCIQESENAYEQWKKEIESQGKTNVDPAVFLAINCLAIETKNQTRISFIESQYSVNPGLENDAKTCSFLDVPENDAC